MTGELACVTEFLAEAAAEATQLDADFKGKPKPPLFGIPFSVKDNLYVQLFLASPCLRKGTALSCVQVKGYDVTRGLGSMLGQPAEADFAVVTHMRTLGAVPFARTNVPQTLLQYVSTNPVFGTTLHPDKHDRTPGGSSGGEVALLKAGGIPFGIGSDLGGSLRIPAAFTGLVTLKLTSSIHLSIYVAEIMGREGEWFRPVERAKCPPRRPGDPPNPCRLRLLHEECGGAGVPPPHLPHARLPGHHHPPLRTPPLGRRPRRCRPHGLAPLTGLRVTGKGWRQSEKAAAWLLCGPRLDHACSRHAPRGGGGCPASQAARFTHLIKVLKPIEVEL